MRTYITTLLLATTLILASCGGGNDVASSGASAVSAAASATTTTATASAPSTTTAATTTTEPKVNGQVDERTGVAPVVAQATIWTPYSNGGCLNNQTFGGFWGPLLTQAQYNACMYATDSTTTAAGCGALGGSWQWSTLVGTTTPAAICIAGGSGGIPQGIQQ
jgi:hypothetical protein